VLVDMRSGSLTLLDADIIADINSDVRQELPFSAQATAQGPGDVSRGGRQEGGGNSAEEGGEAGGDRGRGGGRGAAVRGGGEMRGGEARVVWGGGVGRVGWWVGRACVPARMWSGDVCR